MDKIQAIKASKAGAIFAFISAGVTAAVVLFVIFTNPKGDLEYWNDPWIFLDAFFVLICGIGMLRHSRAAAIIIFVYFILAKIDIGLDTGKFTWGITLLAYIITVEPYGELSSTIGYKKKKIPTIGQHQSGCTTWGFRVSDWYLR